jgi:hydrogenase-4 membrane subunit HyfE
MMTPEHLHLALNHLPILGLGFAVIPLVIGILKNSRETLFAGILIAMIAGWAVPVVMESGEQAYERYEHKPISTYLDKKAEDVMDVHEERAELGGKVMVATAIFATLLLLCLFFKPSWVRVLSAILVIGCLISMGLGVWIAESGGKIRRVDFRQQQV